jgi:tRNA 2-selenouridine synthase
MGIAPRIEVLAPLQARARYLARAYGDMTAEVEDFAGLIEQLRPYHAAERIEEWQALFAAGAHEDLASALMADHYDPRYAKSRARRGESRAGIALDDLSDAALDAATARIAAEVERSFGRD